MKVGDLLKVNCEVNIFKKDEIIQLLRVTDSNNYFCKIIKSPRKSRIGTTRYFDEHWNEYCEVL